VLSRAGINWDDMQMLSSQGINWVSVNEMTQAGINWSDIKIMSESGINWDDLEYLSDAGVNWLDIGEMSDAGVNWTDLGALSDAGVNWISLGDMTTAGINWDDLGAMTRAAVNWDDVAYMTGTGVNWSDLGITTTSGVNWSDLAAMTAANINWSDLAYLADNARDLVANVQAIVEATDSLEDLTGTPDDICSTTPATLFSKISCIVTATGGEDLTEVVERLKDIQAHIGDETDTDSGETLFGVLSTISEYVDMLETYVGTPTDASTAETVFGNFASISTNINTAKSNAGAALTEAQDIRKELGAKGMTPSTYERIKKLQAMLEDLQTSAQGIADAQSQSSTVATQILNSLSSFLSESAKALGMEGKLTVEGLAGGEAADPKKVYEKLDEINAKLAALKESVEQDKVIIKTWFEGAE